MAVPEQIPYKEYTANGVTSVFPLTFECDDQDHLIVKVDDVESNVGEWSLFDGDIVFRVAPKNGTVISIQRNTPLERSADYQLHNNSFRPKPVNKDFDRIWWKLQELLVQLTFLWSALNSKVAALWIALNKEIRDRIKGDLDIRAWVQVLLNNIASDGILNTLAVTTVESVADLQNLIKWDGRMVYVKSYHVGLAQGGGHFAYNQNRASENDFGVIIKGWIRQNVTYVTPEMFGAKADGISNDSSALQKTFDFSQKNNLIVHGANKEFLCCDVVFDSNLMLSNIKLKNNIFDQNLKSVLTTALVDAARTPLRNVIFDNVHINGERAKLTNMPTSASSEDGGRHGIRIVRPMENCIFRNSSANYCGVEGIMLFPLRNIPASEWKIWIKNVLIENCDFNYNGRHGGSSNSTNGLTLRNVTCVGNGTDVTAGADQTSGGAGRKDPLTGKLYGVGWDFEEYYAASYSTNVLIDNCFMYDNAASGIAFVRTGFITRTFDNIEIRGGKYNKGVAAVSESAIRMGGYLIDGQNWYEMTLDNVDFSGDTLYALRSKVKLFTPKNLLSVSANQSTIISDTSVKLSQWASDIAFSNLLQIKTDGVSQQSLLRVSGTTGSTASVVFWDADGAYSRSNIDCVVNSAGDTSLKFGVNGNNKVEFTSNGGILPNVDATQNLGWTTKRWNNVYASVGTIQTSDERLKTDIQSLDEIEKTIALELKSLIKKYRFKKSIDLKDDKARLHVGIIAQDVEKTFKKHGLNAFDYGLLCFDEWGDIYQDVYEEEILEKIGEFGEIIKETVISETPKKVLIKNAGNQYSVRYDELAMFILSAI